MLDCDAVPFAEHVWLCVLKNFLLDCAVCSRLMHACVMIGGNTQVIQTVTKRLHVWGGNLLFYHYILSVVQPCRVFSNTASIDYVCNLVLSFLFS